MKRPAQLFALMVVATTLQGCALSRSINGNEIIYKWADGNLVHVYDLAKKHFSIMSAAYLITRKKEYSEFGGSVRFCDSEEYLCVIGGTGAAVPRQLNGQTEWGFEDWQCQSDQPILDDVLNEISCVHKGQVTEFVYSTQQGIVSYQNKIGDPPWRVMQLYGNIGLLAPQGDKEAQ